jgi:DNA-binding transcriptional ArsR family regulator
MIDSQPIMTPTAQRMNDEDAASAEAELLDRVFFALSDPVRRAILDRLDKESHLVSELAVPFPISLQAVSRHIQVLARAGLVRQQRSGRISRCSLESGPIFAAAIWINRYSKYWQAQFDLLAMTIEDLGPPRKPDAPPDGKLKTEKEAKR